LLAHSQLCIHLTQNLQVDEDNSGEIEFSEFCRVILKHKAATSRNSTEADTLDAFVALGGNVSKGPQCELGKAVTSCQSEQTGAAAGLT